MSKAEDTQGRIAAVEERLAAAEACGAELTAKLNNLFKLLGPVFDRFAVVDTQQLMINARAGERQAKGRGPTVKLADAGFDGAVDRINNVRKTLVGK
jgi:hypothetical protein